MYLYTSPGDLLREQNQLDEAVAYLSKGIEWGKKCQSDPEAMRDSWIHLARIDFSRGDKTAAFHHLEEAENYVKNYPSLPDIKPCCRNWWKN